MPRISGYALPPQDFMLSGNTSGGTCWPARASRTKSSLRGRALRAVQLRADFVQGRIFTLALRFGLDGATLRSGSVKAQALRGNEKILTCPGLRPGLEALVSSQQNIECFLPIARAGEAFRTLTSFRIGNAFLFVLRLILGFSRLMVEADNAASKLCAWDTRHAMQFLAFGQKHGSTWQGGGHPLRCILPPCRKRHADTVPAFAPRHRGQLRRGGPVSAPSASRGGLAALAGSWRLRP